MQVLSFKHFLTFSLTLHISVAGALYLNKTQLAIPFKVLKGISSIKVKISSSYPKKHSRKFPDNKIKTHPYSFIRPNKKNPLIIEGNNQNKSAKKNISLKKLLGAFSNKARLNSENSPPAYPYIARRMKIQGIVELTIEIKPDGHSGEITISQSSGFPILDEAAKEAATSWIFFDNTKINLEHSVFIKQKIEFSLHNIDQ